MTQPVAPAIPPAPRSLPAGIVMSKFWRETADAPIVKHDHDRPVSEDTDRPVGTWWLCPRGSCKTGEWVFPKETEDGVDPGRPRKPYCASHGTQILPGRSEPADANPKEAARSWLQERLAAKRAALAQAANARIDALRAAGRAEAARIASDVREHVPSAAVSVSALVGDFAALQTLQPLPVYALGTGLTVGGTVLAYVAVYLGELVYARRLGYRLRDMPEQVRRRARARARWIASGVLAAGVWLVIAETIGADISNLRGLFMALVGAVLIGVVNYRPWAAMVARRQADAATRVRAADEAAARIEAEQEAARQAEAAAKAAAEEEARLREQAVLEEAKKIVVAEDDRITAGRKFAERWNKLADEAKPRSGVSVGFEIWRTTVVVEETRKLTVKDAEGETVIGWEFLIRAEPGVLAPTGSDRATPFVAMKPWLASMLEIDVSMLDLAYQPTRLAEDGTKPEPMINHGLVTISETFPLGKPVDHLGPAGCWIDDKGTRWGHAGQDLRGRPVFRRLWTPGQAGGAGRYGVTGSGKSVVTQITAYSDLLLGILPIIHDAGKNAMDFVDFLGIFPVGFTTEHRDIIRETMWAEMKRRQQWIGVRTTKGLGGMEVPADPTWNPATGGPPVRVVWEEFHMHMRDSKFVAMLGEMIRLQRATAIMAELATQGTGLADMGDNNLREQVNQICLHLMRMTDHTAGLTGYRGAYKASDLPRFPGMMIMVDGETEPVPYRSAFIPRDPNNPGSLIYKLRRPNGTPEGEQTLFAPELPEPTIEVFKEHGLWDLWELGKTKSGRERLLSESDPVESTEFPPALAGVLTGSAAPAAKPRVRAEEVVLAMLKHEADAGRPGLTQPEMLASTWWRHIEGAWSKNDGSTPAHTTIGRACNRLATVTEQQSAAGSAPLIASDGGDPARWSLLAAGIERGEQTLILLRSAGVLGPQERAKAAVAAGGFNVADVERQAMLLAEHERIIEETMREAFEQVNR